jgi:hypothetical protein
VRLGRIAIAASFVAFATATEASPDMGACSVAMTARWRNATAAHPIDPLKHVPVVLLNVPRTGPQTRYQEAIAALTRTFRSFKEGAGSGVLTGCCALPVFGSISFDDLSRLSSTKFAPLCGVGRRNLSTVVQVRMEYREQYEQGVGAAPYFWISF